MSSKIMGHRGAKNERPENTLLGIQYALDCGVQAIEIDVHKSKDEKLVVIHDETLDRTTNGHGTVKNFTLLDLKKLDAGEGEKIPTLTEVVDLLVNKDITLFIEIKALNCEFEVAEIIKKNNRYTKTIVKSFNHRIIKKIKEIDPQIKTQALLYGLPIDPVTIVKSAHANGLSISASTVDKTVIMQCHKANMEVTTWNANSLEKMEEFKEMGVDFIGTDYPSLFKIKK